MATPEIAEKLVFLARSSRTRSIINEAQMRVMQ